MKTRFLTSGNNRNKCGENKISNTPASAGFIPETAMKKFTILCMLMLFAVTGLIAQNHTVIAEKKFVPGPAYPTLVDVYITIENFSNVGSFSLDMYYDYGLMKYNSTFTGLSGISVDEPFNGNIRIGWFSGPQTFDDGDTIVKLQFKDYSGGTAMINWNLLNPLVEITNPIGSPYPATFVDGFVTNIDASFTDTVTVCNNPNWGEINITATGGSGNFIYKIDDGTPVTNTTGLFTGLPSETYAISVIDAAYPGVELILDPAHVLTVPTVNGYLYNPRLQTYYCTLDDAVTAASTGDTLQFVYPNTYTAYAYNDPTKSLLFENASGGNIIFEGASPALSIASGSLSFDGIIFQTATNDPTISITGGKLTLRNCTIIESTGYVQTGILVSGGELDAGIPGDPGRNIFVTDGTGNKAITQTGVAVANALCNYYGSVKLFDVASVISGNVAFDPWNDASLNNCFFSQLNGPITWAEKKIAPAGTIYYAISAENFINVDAISLTLDFNNNHLTYITTTNINPNLITGTESINTGLVGNKFFFTWTNNTGGGVSFTGLQKLFDIQFTSTTGTSLLTWDDFTDPSGSDCEYSNYLITGPYLDVPQGDFYKDGFVSDLSVTGATFTDVICKGAADGTITVTAAGGGIVYPTPPVVPHYIYKIDDGTSTVTQTTNLFTGLAPGTYTISVIDADFPVVEVFYPTLITISEPATPLTAQAFESHKVRCKGESNGQAIINASGGWGSYTYSIDGINYQVHNFFDALSVGTYTLYAKDLKGCVVTDVVNITEPLVALSVTGIESKVVSCKAGSDGEATLTPLGGWGGYTFSMDGLNFNLGPVITGLSAGTHTLYVKDDGNCVATVNVTITEPAIALSATAAATKMVSCFGGNDGEITVYSVGGWGSYTYSIDGGVTYNTYLNDIITSLTAGSYTIYVKDQEGCVVTAPETVTEPFQLTGWITGDATICSGQSATVTLHFTGGTPPYTCQYKNNLSPGIFTISTTSPTWDVTYSYTTTTVWTIQSLTDANGCTSTISGSATINVNPLPVVTAADLQTSTDLTNWSSVVGDITNGYLLCVDPLIDYHYLDLNTLTLANVPLATTGFTQNAFTLKTTGLPANFYTYWANKGVVSGASGWQGVMWSIINGNAPMFYIGYDGTDYTLIDGLQYLIGQGPNPLRISGDYPQGLYTFEGTVLDQNGCTSDKFDISIQLNSSPVVTDVTLLQSTDQTNWDPVAGSFSGGYTLCVDPVEPFHYLDINTLTAGINTLKINAFAQNPFFLDVTNLPAGFYPYWAAKGVVTGATGWQGIMWNIINGNAPMFYVNYDGSDYTLVDGLQYQAGSGQNTLRISGDYPQGLYTFTGVVTDVNECISSPFSISIQLNSSPVVTDVTLTTSVNQSTWTPVGGTFTAGYEMCVDPMIPFHYMDINTLTVGVNTLKTNAFQQNPFFLDVTNLPAGFYPYWAAKGVVSGASGWEGIMWDIINGAEPMFYINYDGSDYTLVDGLQYLAGSGVNTLRISGDYPQGLYTFTGVVTDVNECVSSPFSINIQLNSSPVVTDVTLLETYDMTTWTPVSGTFTGGYEMCLDALANYVYLDINTLTAGVNPLKTNAFVQNPFFLETTSLPSGFYSYWAAKGVVSGATGWEGIMWQIINGSAPMFYVNYDGSDYTLVDGLQYQHASVVNPLRISGDYPLGDYTFTGVVTDVNECVSSPFSITLKLNQKPMISFGFNGVEAGHNATFDYCYNETVEVKLHQIYGGVAPFSVTYEVNGVTSTVTGLNIGSVISAAQLYTPGLYNIVVTDITDDNGCHASPAFLAFCQATMIIHPMPEIVLTDPSPKVCYGATSVDFPFTSTTNGPDHYSILWSPGALSYGFMDVLYVPFTTSPIVVTMPGMVVPGAYTGQLVVINSITGCASTPYTITVNVPAPVAAYPYEVPVTCFGSNDGMAYTNASGGWGNYSYLWNDPAAQTTEPATGLVAGTYQVTITDEEGCTATASVTVTEPGKLNATVNKTDITCYGLTDGTITISNPTGGHGTFEYRLDNGNWQQSPLFTGLGPGTYTVEIRDAAYVSCTVVLGSQTIIEPQPNIISGYFTYYNLLNTPMNHVTVYLRQGVDTLYTTVTDINGYYSFPSVCPGTYEVISTTLKPEGSINATDAVQVNIWGISGPNYPPIEKVRFKAGNVVANDVINSLDAARILNYFVTAGNPPFSVSPWVFWKANDLIAVNNFTDGMYPTITVANTSLTQDFYGLVSGDFNRSFIPGSAKSGGSVVLNHNTSMPVDGQHEFYLPITAGISMDVTAASLIMNYPADKIEVVGVCLGNDLNSQVLFNAENGELRIGWNALIPMILSNGDALFTLKLKTLPSFTSGETATFTLTMDPLNELAGDDFQVITHAILNIASLESTVGTPELPGGALITFSNYPNPFNHNTTFTYTLPSDGHVSMEIYDLAGRKVDMPVNRVQTAGSYTFTMDNTLLSAGIYTASLKLHTPEGILSRTIKIVSRK